MPGSTSLDLVHSHSRRSLLKAAAAAPFVTGLAGFAQQGLASCRRDEGFTAGYGPLREAFDVVTGLPLILLPEGFTYRTLGWNGDVMNGPNGVAPGGHDGMAVVSQRRVGRSTETVLIRNHELAVAFGNSPLRGAPTYDGGALLGLRAAAGTTTLVIRDGELVQQYPSLAGTIANCAGGPTPWGSWLSCEEATQSVTRAHGYVFEVDGSGPNPLNAQPITTMGRMEHEAAAVDPVSFDVYLTEDKSPVSGLYRFIPNDRSGIVGAYQAGGVLTAARVREIVQSAGFSTVEDVNRDGIASPCIGDEYVVEWVELPNPNAAPTNVVVEGSNRACSGPFAQGWAQGCLRMRRGEGAWHHEGRMYFVDTSTRAVWELTLSSDRLRCIYVSAGSASGNSPDNITVSPRGGILLCEDGGNSPDEFGPGSRLFGLTAEGMPFQFAKNNINFTLNDYRAVGKNPSGGTGDQRGGEWCGACWDPTGRVLYVNIQTPGITFAITGPWARGVL